MFLCLDRRVRHRQDKAAEEPEELEERAHQQAQRQQGTTAVVRSGSKYRAAVFTNGFLIKDRGERLQPMGARSRLSVCFSGNTASSHDWNGTRGGNQHDLRSP